MNAYLNPKKNSKGIWETPAMVACALMAVSSAVTLKDFAAEENWTTFIVGIALMLAFAWGVFRYFVRAKNRHSAQMIARTLNEIPEDKLTFARLQSLMPQGKIIQEIKRLLDMGYLQNMYVDWKLSTLHLTAPSRQAASYIKRICPYCGAENIVVKGRATRCEYCEQVLNALGDDEDE